MFMSAIVLAAMLVAQPSVDCCTNPDNIWPEQAM